MFEKVSIVQRTSIVVLMLMMTAALASRALAFGSDEIGTTGFNFVKIGIGARPVAMWSAFTGLADDVSAIYWNPGGLAAVGERQATTTYLNYLAGIQSGFAGLLWPLDETNAVGVGLSYLTSGDIPKLDEQGNDLGTFGSSALALAMAYGREVVPDVWAGVSLKGLYQTIDDYSAHGVALDLGVLYRSRVPGLTAGAAVLNLGTQTGAFIDEKDPLPTEIRIGGAYRPAPFAVGVLDVAVPFDNDPSLRLGAEVLPHPLFTIRAGYNTLGSQLKVGSEKDVLGGMSFGMGATWQKMRVDYAYSPYVELGSAHRVSLVVHL